jgi:hypothetical protein
LGEFAFALLQGVIKKPPALLPWHQIKTGIHVIKTSYRLIIIVVTAALLGIGMTGHDAPIESSARSLLFGFLPQPQVTLPVTALQTCSLQRAMRQ